MPSAYEHIFKVVTNASASKQQSFQCEEEIENVSYMSCPFKSPMEPGFSQGNIGMGINSAGPKRLTAHFGLEQNVATLTPFKDSSNFHRSPSQPRHFTSDANSSTQNLVVQNLTPKHAQKLEMRQNLAIPLRLSEQKISSTARNSFGKLTYTGLSTAKYCDPILATSDNSCQLILPSSDSDDELIVNKEILEPKVTV
jgi:hypothetical protein